MGRGCSTNGEKRNAYKMLIGKQEGNRPLGRPICWKVDNIKMDLRCIRWSGMDWSHLECSCEHGIEPSGPIKCWEVAE
jgi:hypothetical protein